MNSVAQRAKVYELEAAMLALPAAQIECPVRHFFAENVYGRELFMPKGSIVAGKLHKKSHIFVLASGEISIGLERIKAPHIFVSEPGAKRAIYAHEDSVLFTAHGTSLTDVEQIEVEIIAASEAEYLAFTRALEAV